MIRDCNRRHHVDHNDSTAEGRAALFGSLGMSTLRVRWENIYTEAPPEIGLDARRWCMKILRWDGVRDAGLVVEFAVAGFEQVSFSPCV